MSGDAIALSDSVQKVEKTPNNAALKVDLYGFKLEGAATGTEKVVLGCVAILAAIAIVYIVRAVRRGKEGN